MSVAEVNMAITAFLDSHLFTWVLMPALIFLARILDVSIGTIRLIFIARGYRFLAPILGFFEVMIWLLVVRQVLVNVSNIACYIAYGAGFAAGTFVGMVIEEHISLGNVIVRVVSRKDSSRLIRTMKNEGFVITTSGARCPDGSVRVMYLIIRRHDIAKAVRIIREHNPKSFYSIEDVRFVSQNAIDLPVRHKTKRLVNGLRKGK